MILVVARIMASETIPCPNPHNFTDGGLLLQTLLSEQEWTNLETKNHSEVILADVNMGSFCQVLENIRSSSVSPRNKR